MNTFHNISYQCTCNSCKNRVYSISQLHGNRDGVTIETKEVNFMTDTVVTAGRWTGFLVAQREWQAN